MTTKIAGNGSWGRIRNRQGLLTRSVILRVAQQIAERFHPEKIILFGSYAYGRPQQYSDIDLLVVMKARNEIDQSLSIEESLDAPFGLDVIVRTPRKLAWRLQEGDWFLREAVGKGKVLYEKGNKGVGAKGGSRLGSRAQNPKRQAAPPR